MMTDQHAEETGAPDDPVPTNLSPEEKRAVERQGRLLKLQREAERRLRAEGRPVPGPFDGAEWGD